MTFSWASTGEMGCGEEQAIYDRMDAILFGGGHLLSLDVWRFDVWRFLGYERGWMDGHGLVTEWETRGMIYVYEFSTKTRISYLSLVSLLAFTHHVYPNT